MKSSIGDIRGFTLIETLVGLSVSALVVTALASGSSMILRHQGAMDEIARGEEQLLSVERAFRSVVSRAMPDVRIEAESNPVAGSPSGFEIPSLGPDSLLQDRPIPIEMRVDQGKESQDIYISWTDASTGTLRRERVVLGARSASFSYFIQADGHPRGWQQNWTDPRTLPLAISLRLELTSLGPPVDIVVRTTSALPAACLALPHEPFCRREGDL